MDLDEKEQRNKFLLLKINSELDKFKNIKDMLDKKQKDIINEAKNVGVTNVDVTLYSGDKENINEIIDNHLLELENLKKYISNELDKIGKQKKLFVELQKKFGNNIIVDDVLQGNFKIKYDDHDIDDALQSIMLSKKTIQGLRENKN